MVTGVVTSRRLKRTMIEYLLSFSKFALLVNIGALVLYQFIAPKKTAFTIIVFITILLGVMHIGWEILLFKISENETFLPLVKHLWYIGFAASDFIAVSICAIKCKKNNLKLDRVSQFILFTYLAFGFIQLLRYADRIVIKTDILGGVYSSIIPALNLGVVVAVCFSLIITLFYFIERIIGTAND